MALLAVVLLVVSPLSGYAGSTHVFVGAHFSGGHWHGGAGHSHIWVGHPRVWVGYRGWWGPWFYWGAPVVVGPPYAPPPVVMQQQPPVYAEPEQNQNYWYYCQNPQGYYPYINSCPGGWMKVVPQPAPPNP
jgi:hypothetical protein